MTSRIFTTKSLTKTRAKLVLLFVLVVQLQQAFGEDVTTSSVTAADDHKLVNDDPPASLENDKCTGGHSRLKNFFSWENYTVLGGMLVISCGIGFFYGFFGPKQTTSKDFLLGGSSMGTVPMALSLATSYITAIELLGNPAEMYNYGSQFWMICISFILIVPLTSKLYLPVFMKLRLTSSFEYFSLRFGSNTRYLASGLYILQMVFYTSVAVYAPALALSHVTGLNTYIAVTVVYVVCIFYASQGGMKAVIMTDTFQAAVLVGSIILVLVLGESFIGGPEAIWSENWKTHRLELFNMNFDPTIRHSFWSVVIGGTFYWMTMFASNQASIQKYLSVETISQVRIALWVSAFGLIFIYSVNFYTGMIMVSHYKDCDPLRAGDITASDQLLPLYIINELGHLKGVAGFFVAGIFAASLGTVASALNCLSAVTCQDIIQGALKIKIAESKGARLAKWISILYGVISFGLVFVVEQLGSVMQVALSFNGMVGGITFGLFSLGMFFPWANSKGAIFGAVTSIALVVWMGLGNQLFQASGDIGFEPKHTSIENCPCLLNKTIEAEYTTNTNHEVFFLYRISYLWYSAIGSITTVVLGLVMSYFTGFQDPRAIDSDLLSPPVRNLLDPKKPEIKKSIHEKISECSKATLMGIVNIGLDMEDEKNRPYNMNKKENVITDNDKITENKY